MEQTDLIEWIKNYVSEITDISAESIDPNIPFERYGLDSTAAVGLSGELSEMLGKELDANLVFNYPTISKVAAHICSEA